jgi:TolA-binding protein
MKTIYNTNDCLSFHQLKGYVNKSSTAEDTKLIYIHITSCELCASAVNGFTMLPFTTDEVEELNFKVDTKVNATKHWHRINISQVLMAAASVMIIIGFYKLVNSYAVEQNDVAIKTINIPEINVAPVKQIAAVANAPIVSSAKKETKPSFKTNTNSKTKDNARLANSDESIQRIAVNFNKLFLSGVTKSDIINPAITDDVMYIEDLKVVDYKKTYFYTAPLFTDIFTSTEASAENKTKNPNEQNSTTEHKPAAYQVLKKGLQLFKKQQCLEANTEFELLIEKNNNDVNALFYSGICLCELGVYHSAIKQFKQVIAYPNHQFAEEAKWKLALTYYKQGDMENANILFKEIVNDDGFYAQKAKGMIY